MGLAFGGLSYIAHSANFGATAPPAVSMPRSRSASGVQPMRDLDSTAGLGTRDRVYLSKDAAERAAQQASRRRRGHGRSLVVDRLCKATRTSSSRKRERDPTRTAAAQAFAETEREKTLRGPGTHQWTKALSSVGHSGIVTVSVAALWEALPARSPLCTATGLQASSAPSC